MQQMSPLSSFANCEIQEKKKTEQQQDPQMAQGQIYFYIFK